MKAVLALLLGLALGKDELAWKQEITRNFDDIDHVAAFKNWAETFGKEYGDIEEAGHRFLVFLDNWKLINDHNLAGNSNYTMRLNQFGDLTGEEFRYYVHGHGESCLIKKNTLSHDVIEIMPEQLNVNAPTSIDWTNVNGKSYVTPVKNQGQCGSCWAFSATGSIEAQSAIKNGVTGSAITTLSEQQLVDCSTSEGNHGCNGGLMDYAFKYVQKEGGLCSESEYPYTARNGQCKATTCGTKYYPITGYKDVQHKSMDALVTAVAAGPTSVGIEADQTAFQHYSGGILDGVCGTRIDHGVLAVGYGSQGSQQYWKVKNSWGASWGMNGYVLICKDCGKNNGNGECGILDQESYPTL